MDNVNSPVLLNLGCGFNKLPGHINVDAFDYKLLFLLYLRRITSIFSALFADNNLMTRFPRLLKFCADHMRGFIWEQRFEFSKIGGANG